MMARGSGRDLSWSGNRIIIIELYIYCETETEKNLVKLFHILNEDSHFKI